MTVISLNKALAFCWKHLGDILFAIVLIVGYIAGLMDLAKLVVDHPQWSVFGLLVLALCYWGYLLSVMVRKNITDEVFYPAAFKFIGITLLCILDILVLRIIS